MPIIPNLTGDGRGDHALISQELDNIQPLKSGARATNGSEFSSTSKSEELASKEGLGLKNAGTESVAPIKGWPTGPTTLEKRGLMDVLGKIYEYFLFLSPSWFIALAGLAAHFNDKPQSAAGDRVVFATSLAPTILPILFDALVEEVMKTIALWRAERGSKLGTLEQLMSSGSLYSAVTFIWIFRAFNLLSIGLLALLALSPLGGQASLRLINVVQSPLQSNEVVQYLSTNSSTYFDTQNDMDFYNYAITGLFTSSSILATAASQNASTDAWGNIKIPTLESLQNTNPNLSPSDWLPVNPANTTYSSYLGIPLGTLPESDQANFTVESWYFLLKCGSWHIAPFGFVLDSIVSPTYVHANTSTLTNMTNQYGSGFWMDTTTSTSRLPNGNFDPNSPLSLPPPTNLPPRTIVYGGLTTTGGQNNNAYIFCNLTHIAVESHVTCQNTSACAVDRQRASTLDKTSPNFTVLDLVSQVPFNLLTFFPQSAGAFLNSATSSIMEQFIASNGNGTKALNITTDFGPASLDQLSPDVFASRFGRLFNTYYQAATSPQLHMGNVGELLPESASNSSLGDGTTVLSSTADVIRFAPYYKVDWTWFGILLAVCAILFIVSVAGLWFKHSTLAPDVLGSVSSLTRDNPYIKEVSGSGSGSALDGVARAYLLKRVKVRIMDVRGAEGVGHVTLASDGAFAGAEGDGEKGFGVTRLRKGRLYD